VYDAQKQFRYENVWQTCTKYEKLVKDSWQWQNHTPGLHGIVEFLGALQREFETRGMREFGCLSRTFRQLQKKLDKFRKKLDKLGRQSIGCGPFDEEKSATAKLHEVLRQEEVWLR
jgi:hypothetical protein